MFCNPLNVRAHPDNAKYFNMDSHCNSICSSTWSTWVLSTDRACAGTRRSTGRSRRRGTRSGTPPAACERIRPAASRLRSPSAKVVVECEVAADMILCAGAEGHNPPRTESLGGPGAPHNWVNTVTHRVVNRLPGLPTIKYVLINFQYHFKYLPHWIG